MTTGVFLLRQPLNHGYRTRAIKVSINELSALLKRTFEAVYSRHRDYEDTAKLVLWLETHCLHGIATLKIALPELEKTDSPKIALLTDDPERCIIDAGGRSLFDLANIATDITIANCSAVGYCHCSIISSLQQNVILPCLARYGSQGFAAAAWWYDEADGHLHFARIRPEQVLPDYTIVTIDNKRKSNRHNLELICCTDESRLIKKLAGHVALADKDSGRTEIPATELAQRFETNLNDGISLADEDYQRLCNVADRVLVEATAKSRHGAGE